MNIGRPVLVAPPRASAAPVDGVVLVAWKEGREAQRAVAAALPLLKQAREVKVVEICASADAAASAARVADVAAWLRRHGVVAESEAKVRDERPAGDRILALVEQMGANLIVSGAWGHSRMREWVLGGVTQALLNRSQSWLLLSH
jgi:nucleotide-binding universal stress UspA family protein